MTAVVIFDRTFSSNAFPVKFLNLESNVISSPKFTLLDEIISIMFEAQHHSNFK